jgi:hypothetical protein
MSQVSILRMRKQSFEIANESLAGDPPDWLKKEGASWTAGTVIFGNGIEADVKIRYRPDWKVPGCDLVIKFFDVEAEYLRGGKVCGVIEQQAASVIGPFQIDIDGEHYEFIVMGDK